MTHSTIISAFVLPRLLSNETVVNYFKLYHVDCWITRTGTRAFPYIYVCMYVYTGAFPASVGLNVPVFSEQLMIWPRYFSTCSLTLRRPVCRYQSTLGRYSHITNSKMSDGRSLCINALSDWNQEFHKDPTHNLGSTVLKNFNADDALLCKTRLVQQDNRVFNVKLSNDEINPVTNQKASGRCWLFASTNQLRPIVMKKLNLKEFELSQAYLFFYDKLEKANYFLDQIIDTYQEPIDSRLVQYLLQDPVQDGGQYSMFLNLVQKYGLIPKDLYDDTTYSTTASRKMNSLLTTKLRDFAQQLRDTITKNGNNPAAEAVTTLRAEMQKEIFKLLTLFMDLPPVRPDQKFKWDYVNKDKEVKVIECTPMEFAEQYCELPLSKPETLPVSLINDPRHEYGKLIKIDRLGNVIGGSDVLYLNVDSDTLSRLVVKRLQNDKGVFFGSDVPKYMEKKHGIMDIKLWNYKAVGYELEQSKADRIRYHETMMTHAMLINGAHVEKEGELPVRYRVENSWGKDSGKDGYYVMSQEYFEQYCFQIVVDLDELPSELAEKFTSGKEAPIVLPIWDPMGALAN